MIALPEQFYQSVARAPAANAVRYGATVTSYEELWADAAAFARFLADEGIEAGARVALLLNNSATYIAAYYGIWRAGGVVVALNAAAKADDLAAWLEHCGARWLVADTAHPETARLLERLRGELRLVLVGDATRHPAAASWAEICRTLRGKEPALAAMELDALAGIIYTSGTTGHPKGVMLSHGNLAANAHSIRSYLPIRSTSRTVNVLPFYYSYGNSVLHTHLAAGACLVLENSLVYPHRVVERIVAERADGFAGVPATFALLLSRVRLEEYDLSCLRYVTLAGGAMPPHDIKRLAGKLKQTQLFVMYGQTEASARLTYLPPEKLHEKIGSCGVPIAGVEIDVRDEDGRSVAAGMDGEVWVRGPNVMQGYWNDRDATHAVLRDGWLRTRDIGRRDAEGYLYLQGRRNDMIKTGAHRVHPAEIEQVIAEIPGIAEVAAVGVDDEILGQAIKAVICVHANAAVDAVRVKAHCRDRLAAYKIPKYVEFVRELPKTTSGKVQRYLLAVGGGEAK